MRNLLTICVCLLLVCALTTSLIGSPSPSFEVVLQKCSDIEINLDILLTSVEAYQDIYMEYQDVSSLEGFDKIGAILNNFLAEVVNSFWAVAGFVVNGIILIEGALSVFFVFIEIGIYLLFGLDVNLPDRLTSSLF